MPVPEALRQTSPVVASCLDNGRALGPSLLKTYRPSNFLCFLLVNTRHIVDGMDNGTTIVVLYLVIFTLITTYITTGAPISGVTALRGIMPEEPGR